MVIDCTTFNGEYDLFELRYQILKDVVDEFRVIEFDTTFSGKDKPCYVETSADIFYDTINHWPKVKYYSIEKEQWSKYLDMAAQSPNTKGASHWKTEFAQKESIKDCLTDLKDDDIVFIGDCDEIWSPILTDFMRVFPTPLKLKLLVYTYYLNNKSNEEFYGTIMSEYGYIKSSCLNHLRTQAQKSQGEECGWHFTSMGGYQELKRKLDDSYTTETYNNSYVQKYLESNIINNKDFLGRDFTYTLDETEWPQYLKDNREKYKHLLR